ncbi:hypothetical protein ABEW61_10105 [Paenibacillus amylolyticus]|uniref:hypothetical protein n=1 Tax=Paenibacillus amylolyticus TaxID=1451 RepID=UPI003D281C52
MYMLFRSRTSLYTCCLLVIFLISITVVGIPGTALALPIEEKELPQVSSKEHLRFRATFSGDVQNGQMVVTVKMSTTSFDTGERMNEKFTFNQPPIKNMKKSSIDLNWRNRGQGELTMTPAGLKAYGIIDPEDGVGGVLFEFNLKTETLRKVVDLPTDATVFVYPSAGAYMLESNSIRNPASYLYRITDSKPIPTATRYPDRFSGVGERFMPWFKKYPGYGTHIISSTDSKNPTMFTLIDGQLKKLAIQASTEESNIGYTRRIIPFKKEQLELYMPHTYTPFSENTTTLSYTKGKKKKILFKGKGYLMTFMSPNQKYMLLSQEIVEKGKLQQLRMYLYDLSGEPKLVREIKPHYGLGSRDVVWFSDDLMMINYSTGMPNTFPPVFYSVTSDYAIPADDQTFMFYKSYSHPENYWDNFSYEQLNSLNDPVPFIYNGKYLVFKGQGPFSLKGKTYFPIKAFAEQTGVTLTTDATHVNLTKDNNAVTLFKKDLPKSFGNLYMSTGDLRKLGFKFTDAGAHGFEFNDSSSTVQTE